MHLLVVMGQEWWLQSRAGKVDPKMGEKTQKVGLTGSPKLDGQSALNGTHTDYALSDSPVQIWSPWLAFSDTRLKATEDKIARTGKEDTRVRNRIRRQMSRF